MAEHTPTHEGHEVTSIDPLNLALTARSLKTRIWWWFVTIVVIIALATAIALLVGTYNKKPTSVITVVSIYLFSARIHTLSIFKGIT